MKITKWLIILMLLIITAVPALAQDSAFEPSTCPFNNISGYPIDCGWLTVPENHNEPQGQTIRLAVAIIRSLNPQKAPDPVFYIEGGPGGAVVGMAPLKTTMFTPILAERDVVLMDQRGVGLSRPAIVCQPYTDATPFIESNFLTEPILSGVEICRQRLEADGVQVQFYNSTQSAADFAALRTALGYDQINLFGVSYGTRVGLLVARNHPEGLRSVILDSVLPPEVNTLEQSGSLETSLALLEHSCQQDIVCRLAYPNLRQQFVETYQRLEETPLTLEFDGKTVTYSGKSFAGAVYNQFSNQAGMLGMGQTTGFITDVAAGNNVVLRDSLALFMQDGIQLPNLGIGLAVICSDSAPYTSNEQINAAIANTPQVFRLNGSTDGMTGYRLCETWGIPSPETTVEPGSSDVPVLMLQGSWDSFTPTAWAQQTAQTLTKNTLIEFPGQGHVVTRESCPQQVMLAFLNAPDTTPNTSCIAEMQTAPTFILTTRVTRPIVQGASIVLMAAAIIGVGSAGWTLLKIPTPWRGSARKMGWIPAAISAASIVVFVLDREQRILNTIQATTIIQLMVALQMAMTFAPDDEPGLEMMLALPRPVSAFVLERFAVVLIIQGLIAVVGGLVIYLAYPGQDLAALLIGWLPPALFLGGISLYVTLKSRITLLGALLAGLLWVLFGLFADIFKSGQAYPFPLNLMQPFLWAVDIHATPDTLGGDFWLNRLFLTGAGIALMMLALNEVRDKEKVLLNFNEKSRRKQTKSAVLETVGLKTKTVSPVDTVHSPLRQWMGITWYEFRMHRQRRTFKVITLTMILTSALFLTVAGVNVDQILPVPPIETLSLEQAGIFKSLLLILLAGGNLLTIPAILTPLLVADSVPLDRQQHVDDLLYSLPVPSWVYLTGKVTGVWLTAVSSILTASIVIGVIWWLRAGTFNPLPFIDLMLIGTVPIVLTSSGIAVLVGATQPTRRRAVFVLIAVAIIPAFLQTGGLLTAMHTPILEFLDYYYMQTFKSIAVMPLLLPSSGLMASSVTQTLIVSILQLLFFWAIVWGWWRVRHNR